MGTLVVNEYLTLDGVGQAPGGPEEDPSSGFALGGWQAPFIDEASGAAMLEHAREMDAMLLGRRTYELFVGYWPTASEANPFAALMNRVPKHVVTRTLHGPLSWQNSEVVSGELVPSVAALTERYAQVHVIGSLDLCQSLLREGLVDRLHLWIHPIVLGEGKRLFADGTVPAALHLIASNVDATGNVQLTYSVGDAPTTGLRVDDDALERIDVTTS
jgi:dihydrofolate reductase